MGRYRSIVKITGSVGDMTFTNWKGVDVVKQKVAPRSTSNTPLQARQRSRFGVLSEFGGLIGNALRVGFRTAATEMTPQNVFTSVNKDALRLDGGEWKIEYGDLKISAGTVAPVEVLVVTVDAPTGRYKATWQDNSNGADALPTDVFNVTLVDEANVLTYIYSGPVQRSAGTVLLPAGVLNTSPIGDLRAYAFFKRVDGPATSNSVTTMAS